MKIPDISIIDHGIWHNSKKRLKTSARFVLSYEIEFHRNSFGETIINDVPYPIKDHTVIFCRPGDIRYSKFSPDDIQVEIHYFYFVLAPEKNILFEKLLNRIPTCIEADRDLLENWDKLATQAKTSNDTISEMQMHMHLLLLLTALAQKGQEHASPGTHSAQQQAIFEAIRYMNEHVTESLSVTEMANHIGYSPSRFNSIFKNFTHRTPHAYYISLKISEAKYMLLNTNKSISEISEALAFSKASKFNTAFKKECYITPGQFRKNRAAVFYHEG